MKSLYFNDDHQLFRQSARQFIEAEVLPYATEWEEKREIPREIWHRMGELGFLGLNLPEEYGGTNLDFFYSVVWTEEVARSMMGGFAAALGVHQYMSVAHIAKAGSPYIKQQYLTAAISGQKVGALAITEPGGGSDVAALRTTARREGDEYVINGSKTFITNGCYADFVVVACRLPNTKGVDGVSLIIVDRECAGFSASKLRKMGWHSSDTAELFFDNVRVPARNLIGQEGMGFYYIMESFQLERLIAGIGAIAGAEIGMELTLKYINERQAFGKPIAKYQSIRHDLVDIATEVEAAKQLTYYASWLYEQGETAVKECSMVKLLTTEVAKKAADVCLQFFGGFGYMEEYPIERLYRDARVGTIVGGTSAIMREILAKIIIDNVTFKSGYERPAASNAQPKAAVTQTLAVEQPESNTENNINNNIFSSSQNQETTQMAAPQTAREIVLSLPSRLKTHKLAPGYESNVQLDISGGNGGQFTVHIKDNACVVTEGFVGDPTCKVTTTDSTYEGVELGRENAQMAVMFGKIKITNLAEMMTFTGLFERLA